MKNTEIIENKKNIIYIKNKLEVLFQNLSNVKGTKALYKEGSLRCIIWIDKIEITDTEFSATAQFISLIDEFNQKDESKISREWTFSSIYDNLIIYNSGLKAHYLWEIWTDQDFIVEIEQLVLEKKFKEVNYKMAVFKNSSIVPR